jgi:hypothetical protein
MYVRNETGREISVAWVLMWKFICPVLCGVLFLAAMVSEILGALVYYAAPPSSRNLRAGYT